MTSTSGLYSLLKVGALTFFGAFLAALTFTKIPESAAEWKGLIFPCLATAIAAEVYFLRTQIAALVAQLAGQLPSPPAAPPPPAPAPAKDARGGERGVAELGVLVRMLVALALLGVCAWCAARDAGAMPVAAIGFVVGLLALYARPLWRWARIAIACAVVMVAGCANGVPQAPPAVVTQGANDILQALTCVNSNWAADTAVIPPPTPFQLGEQLTVQCGPYAAAFVSLLLAQQTVKTAPPAAKP